MIQQAKWIESGFDGAGLWESERPALFVLGDNLAWAALVALAVSGPVARISPTGEVLVP